jgi:dipeptidyl-peptidase-4
MLSLVPMNPLIAAAAIAMTVTTAHVAALTPAWPTGALTPERAFASPSLSGPAARGVEVSPDGRFVTYLKPEPNNQYKLDLWAAPAAGGEAKLLVSGESVEPTGVAISDEEKARRERQRTAALSGVVDYHWDEKGEAILIPAGGALYLADAATGRVRKLEVAKGATDAKVSPAGHFASYVREQNLYVIPLGGGAEHAITTGGKDAVSYGVAEFVAQEEMGRYTGYWWAPGDAAIAYTRVDEAPVKLVDRLEIGAEGSRVVTQRYPRPGEPNAIVELYVQAMTAGAKPVKVHLGADTDIYLARVNWSKDGKDLYVQRQSRDQQTLDLLRVDPATGAATLVIHEHQTPWIPLTDDFHALKDGGFIWGSGRTGVNQLYLYASDGKLVRQITHGDYPSGGGGGGAGTHAPGLAGVDEAKGVLYFMASGDTPVERQLYAVSYRKVDTPKAITTGHGWWTAVMPKSAGVFVGYYSDPATPPQSALYDISGKRLHWIEENALGPNHPFAPYAARYPKQEFGVLKAADGQDLHFIIQKPAGFDPARKYPVIVEVYGGPGVQSVTRAWRSTNEKLYLEAGYVLFQLDNRGSTNRPMKFESPIYKRMGSVEVDDQVTGIEWLRTQPFVDPARIGVSGWSYGGYMTLAMLTDPRTGLKAGASGAPPTDWRDYDTHYTERYMGDPRTDKAAYDASAIIPRLPKLSGRLLLLQGIADDNVQFTNSIAVMAALQAQSKPFDLMLFPGQRHGVQGEPRQLQLWRTFLQFFARELGGSPPPGLTP